MIRIIETNYNIKADTFQSRVIEVESWDYVVNQFTEEEIVAPKIHEGSNGYSGVIRPRQSKIKRLVYNEYRLSCDIITYNGKVTKKLIEIMEE